MIQSIRIALVTVAFFSTSLSAQEKALASIAARYEQTTEFLDNKRPTVRVERLFFREHDRVEFRTGDIGEIWERDGNNRLTLYKIAYGEHAVIEYLPSDLRAMDSLPNWEKLESFIDPDTFIKQAPKATTTALSRAANVYRLNREHIDTEIVWLTQEKLPGLVRGKDAEKIVTLKLLELDSIDESAFKPTSVEQLRHYKLFEFSDIGDKENDPFVRRLSQIFGHNNDGH